MDNLAFRVQQTLGSAPGRFRVARRSRYFLLDVDEPLCTSEQCAISL